MGNGWNGTKFINVCEVEYCWTIDYNYSSEICSIDWLSIYTYEEKTLSKGMKKC